MVFSYKYHNSSTSKQGIIGLLSQKNTRRYYISQCFEDLRHARIPTSCVQYVVCGRKWSGQGRFFFGCNVKT